MKLYNHAQITSKLETFLCIFCTFLSFLQKKEKKTFFFGTTEPNKRFDRQFRSRERLMRLEQASRYIQPRYSTVKLESRLWLFSFVSPGVGQRFLVTSRQTRRASAGLAETREQ